MQRTIALAPVQIDSWTVKFILRCLYAYKGPLPVKYSSVGHFKIIQINNAQIWIDVRFLDTYTPEISCRVCGSTYSLNRRTQKEIDISIGHFLHHIKCSSEL